MLQSPQQETSESQQQAAKCRNRECSRLAVMTFFFLFPFPPFSHLLFQGYKARPRSLYCSKKCQAREQNIRQGRVRPVRLSSVAKKRTRSESHLSPKLPFHEIMSAQLKAMLTRQNDHDSEKLSPILYQGLPIVVVNERSPLSSSPSQSEDMVGQSSSDEPVSPCTSPDFISPPPAKRVKLAEGQFHREQYGGILAFPSQPTFPSFRDSKPQVGLPKSEPKQEEKLCFRSLLPSFQSGLPPPVPCSSSPREVRYPSSSSSCFPCSHPVTNPNSDVDVELIAQVLSSLSSGPILGLTLGNCEVK